MARFIVGELYSTEKSFHRFLIFIRKNYMEPMKAATLTKNPLVKTNDVQLLFCHLPELIAVSEKILVRLEQYAKQGHELPHKVSPSIAVGQIFTDLEEDFVIFLKYAIHYQSYMKAIRRASTSSFVMKIDTESKRVANAGIHHRLGLADYLIAPFQRVPRYELLLKGNVFLLRGRNRH
ncbi:Dbl homology domain-containing protein [Mycotypha africana]|uniref:rho guanine nucleotide exchange factor n=1 Tax=Mycotypha africana TaxID=64632 RepID=UPI002300F04F|nr:rho guanine nucleotide exchange factor [Mycotypha africana]KAI8984617.1 Dbl homology domain-containing protein [Mycotypha africana]